MKSLIALLVLLLPACYANSQTINISTGQGAVNTNEPTWKVGTTSPATGTPFIKNLFPGTWETAPVAGTGANWILPTPANGNGQTTYIYERLFNVPSGKRWLRYNFKVAADDVLNSIELVQPGTAGVINIPFTTLAAYKFTREVSDSIQCPVTGDWKIRIKVFCGDPVGTGKPTGVLVSGYVTLVNGECSKPLNPCCPPWNSDVLKSFMVYAGSGSIADPYTLRFSPSTLFINQMQQYLNYIHSVSPCNSSLTIEFRMHDKGNGNLPSTTGGWGPQIGPNEFVTWNWNTSGIGAPTGIGGFFPGYNMQVGNWYAIPTGIYTNCDPSFFSLSECNPNGNNTIYVRIQVLAARSTNPSDSRPMLEISDGKKIIESMPIDVKRKN